MKQHTHLGGHVGGELTRKALHQHLAWQRHQLQHGSSSEDRFLVLRPGDKTVACVGATGKAYCLGASRFASRRLMRTRATSSVACSVAISRTRVNAIGMLSSWRAYPVLCQSREAV